MILSTRRKKSSKSLRKARLNPGVVSFLVFEASFWRLPNNFEGKTHNSSTKWIAECTPKAPIVLCANENMIPRGVHRHGGDDASTCQELLDESLLGQVVDADVVLCGHKEPWLCGVKHHAHDSATVLPEGVLAFLLRELVYHHTASGT
jgi:hypothetical protein